MSKIQPRFNDLTDRQEELLHLLIEEATEVIHAATKVLRHGYPTYNPHDPHSLTNKGALEREIADFSAAIILLKEAGELELKFVDDDIEQKLFNVQKYLHHFKDKAPVAE